MGVWACTNLPWHRFVIRKRVSDQSEKITCSCGRSYAMNHNLGVILPWETVAFFYDMVERLPQVSEEPPCGL
jgi:hypothetical protein